MPTDFKNLFAAADAKSSAAVSLIFGERLKLIPWKSGRYTQAGGADPDREAVEFRGTLAGELGTQNMSGDRAENFTGSVTTRDRTVTADTRDWPAHGKNGDRIQALDLPGQPLYEIAGEPVDDGSGNRVIVPLVTTK